MPSARPNQILGKPDLPGITSLAMVYRALINALSINSLALMPVCRWNPEILAAFNHVSEKPKLILAKTIKGKGFSFSENNNDWHHNIMTQQQYEKAIKELNE